MGNIIIHKKKFAAVNVPSHVGSVPLHIPSVSQVRTVLSLKLNPALQEYVAVEHAVVPESDTDPPETSSKGPQSTKRYN